MGNLETDKTDNRRVTPRPGCPENQEITPRRGLQCPTFLLSQRSPCNRRENLIEFAVVGCGYWGRKVIRELLTISKVKLVAVSDVSPEALNDCRKEFGDNIPLYALGYKQLLDSPVEAVHIATPNNTHFEIASEFLRNGKHVLVEKPLTLKTTEAYELVKLSRKKGYVLSVGHIHRFNNGLVKLRHLIHAQSLGELYYLEMRWTGTLAAQDGRDVIDDLAPHPFDICNYLLGGWPKSITCNAEAFRTTHPDLAFITANYENGMVVHVELSWLDPQKRRDVRIIGSRGEASLDCISQELTLQDREVQLVPSNTLRKEILHFIDNILNPDQYANQSDGILGARVVGLLEACRRSHLENRRVTTAALLEVPA